MAGNAAPITFLFTDIEGSTRLWERFPLAMRGALERHDTLMHQIIVANGGHVFKTVGDAFCAAFSNASDALRASVELQQAILAHDWQDIPPLRVRMALHAGNPDQRENDYFGAPVNAVARLLSAGHGGQILLSGTVRDELGEALPASVSLDDLGTHRLRDVQSPVHVFQVAHDGLPAMFPALKTLDYDPHNIPAQLTSFVGRHHELEGVRNLLNQPDIRMLTLTGPGGVGKTRLAMQVATHMREEFPDGRYLVSLAALRDATSIPVAMAQALGVPDTGEGMMIDRIVEHLKDMSLLLVLDNFEHLLDGRELVSRLLESVPGLKILVTSRILLQVYGEQEFVVIPFPVPHAFTDLSLHEIASFEAVALFLDRARSVRPSFALTEGNARTVVEMCARLDGLPLAIELAAARSKLLSPEAIVQRLGARLAFLQGKTRGVPERQQTIRATIQWSHDLLQPDEQALFRWLSVFAGGFTMDSARRLIELFQDAAGEKPVDVLNVDEGIGTLIDNSLIQVIDAGTGEPRLLILETLREFGQEQLVQQGELDTLQRDHAVWCTELAIEARKGNSASNEREMLDLLEAEHDNLRSALAWLNTQPATPDLSLARLAANVWWFWFHRGYRTDWHHWLSLAIEDRPGTLPSDRADALSGFAILRWLQGYLQDAEALLEQSVEISRNTDHSKVLIAALNNLATVKRSLAKNTEALELCRESVAIFRAMGQKERLGTVLGNLANILMNLGRYEEAQATFEEGLAIQRELGDQRGVASNLGDLATIAINLGDLSLAKTLNDQSIRMYEDLDDTRSVAERRVMRCFIEIKSGELDTAMTTLLACREQFIRDNDGFSLTVTKTMEANILAELGRFEEAQVILLEALREDAERHQINGFLGSLHLAVRCRASLGDPLNAIRFNAALGELRLEHSIAVAPANKAEDEDLVRHLRDSVSADAYQQAEQEGQAMDVAACVTLLRNLVASQEAGHPPV